MTPNNDRPPASALEPDGSLLTDRRRHGRPENVSPALIPLLRGEHDKLDPDLEIDDEPDQLSAARGISLGVLLSAPLWVGIVWLGRLILA